MPVQLYNKLCFFVLYDLFYVDLKVFLEYRFVEASLYLAVFRFVRNSSTRLKYVMISVENTKMTPSTTKKKKRPPQRRCGDWCEFLSSKEGSVIFEGCMNLALLNLARENCTIFKLKRVTRSGRSPIHGMIIR